MPLHHHVTTLVSHLPCPLPPNQSVICLAPCHQTSQSFALPPTTVSPRHHISQSFALPPATKPVSHLPCPLPPHHCVTASPCHCVSQSFALPPATKPLCHLLCPLPPNQSVICLAPLPLCHCITALVSHLPCPLPPNQSVICLAPCHQTSQSFALPPTTASLHHHVTALVSHLPCPLPPNQSVICLAPYHCITTSPCHHVTVLVSHLPCPLPPNQSVICLAPCHQTSQSFALPPTTASPHQSVISLAPCHQTSQSFALPPATKPVSHLPCPLPAHHCATASLHHRVTTLVSHLPCPLPPSQSVICLTPCHQTSQSFALPPTTTSLCHHIIASLPQIFPTTGVWIWLVNANQHSSDWLIVPITANQITGIEKPNYHKTLIFFPTTSLKWPHEARIDELADSNEPPISCKIGSSLNSYWSIRASISLSNDLSSSRCLSQSDLDASLLKITSVVPFRFRTPVSFANKNLHPRAKSKPRTTEFFQFPPPLIPITKKRP